MVGFDKPAQGFHLASLAYEAVSLQQTKSHKAMRQQLVFVGDSLGVDHEEYIERADWTISQFFVEGGLFPMIIITLLLIALLVAAWKAPKWVKEIGLGAAVAGIFFTLVGLSNMMDAIQLCGDASPRILAAGLKVAMTTTLYGLVVYFLSLVIRIIQKPRI